MQLARRRHVVLQVGHVERFNPALVSVQDRLHEPKFIEARRQSGYTFRSTDVGVVLDLMIHDIDVVLSLVKSPVTHVDALGVSVLGDHEDMVERPAAVRQRRRGESHRVANELRPGADDAGVHGDAVRVDRLCDAAGDGRRAAERRAAARRFASAS